jgi:replicative DNA helicase
MNQAESALLSHLTSADSLDYLVREGFSAEGNREIIPTELIREITEWVIDFYYRSGRQVAPTVAGIRETWHKQMDDLELRIDDDYETDSIEWAVAEMRSQYAATEVQNFTLKLANDIHNAAPPAKVGVAKDALGDLYALAQALSSHHQEAAADIGLEDAWMRYQERTNARNHVSGLTFGLPEIDNHTMGVKDGEMAIFAGFSGSGKSFFSLKAIQAEWKRGRRTALMTLENSIEMTYDRLACSWAGLSYERWQRGACDEGGLVRFKAAMRQIKETEHAPIVIMPEAGDRDPVSMVRRAFSLGAESLIVDQVSHVEPMPTTRSYQRHEVVAEIIRGFKSLISDGKEKIPLLLLAQIKREGHAAARKSGRYVMDDMAESSEIERSADFVFSGLKQITESNEDGLLLQKLKGRRVSPMPEAWEMIWRLGVGDIRVLREVNHSDA